MEFKYEKFCRSNIGQEVIRNVEFLMCFLYILLRVESKDEFRISSSSIAFSRTITWDLIYYIVYKTYSAKLDF